jgi:hypothetical protein
VLPSEAVSLHRVLLEDLFRTALDDESLLPAAIGEALGISVAEVLDWYYRVDNDSSTLERRVTEAISRLRMEEEGEAWLREMAVELPYHRDDTF